jgi:hypothetical protein
MCSAGLMLGNQLDIRGLQLDSDAWAPAPRARHALLQLPLLQQMLAEAGSAEALQQALLMYGGVAGDGWFDDLHLLLLSETADGDTAVDWQQVAYAGGPQNSMQMLGCNSRCTPAVYGSSPCSLPFQYPYHPACVPPRPAINITGPILTPSLPSPQVPQPADITCALPAGDAPTPRRDFAACCCGKDQFVVHGGFDGSMELPAMFLCTVHTRDEQRKGLAAAKQGIAASTGSSTGSSGSAGSGQAGLLEASWQEVVAVSLATSPGRCYHSITYDSEARCLYVFGGYSSM